MKTRKPLQRRTPLRASRRKPAQGPHPFPPVACALIDARDIDLLTMERCCQWCGSTRHLERHHRRGKASGGSQNRDHTHCPCNGVTLCRKHHRQAHTTMRRLAAAMGFVVSQAVDEPATVGVMRFPEGAGGATMWPSCSGSWLDASDVGEEAA